MSSSRLDEYDITYSASAENDLAIAESSRSDRRSRAQHESLRNGGGGGGATDRKGGGSSSGAGRSSRSSLSSPPSSEAEPHRRPHSYSRGGKSGRDSVKDPGGGSSSGRRRRRSSQPPVSQGEASGASSSRQPRTALDSTEEMLDAINAGYSDGTPSSGGVGSVSHHRREATAGRRRSSGGGGRKERSGSSFRSTGTQGAISEIGNPPSNDTTTTKATRRRSKEEGDGPSNSTNPLLSSNNGQSSARVVPSERTSGIASPQSSIDMAPPERRHQSIRSGTSDRSLGSIKYRRSRSMEMFPESSGPAPSRGGMKMDRQQSIRSGTSDGSSGSRKYGRSRSMEMVPEKPQQSSSGPAPSRGMETDRQQSSRSDGSFGRSSRRYSSSRTLQSTKSKEEEQLLRELSGLNQPIDAPLRRSSSRFGSSGHLIDANDNSVRSTRSKSPSTVGSGSQISNSLAGDSYNEEQQSPGPDLWLAKSNNNNGQATSEGRRESLVDSLAWFSFHAPKSVLEDIVSFCSTNPDFVADDDYFYTDTSSRRRGLNRRGSDISSRCFSVTSADNTEVIENVLAHQQHESSLRQALPLPYSTRRESALLFVDISGFTKLSTMLDVEELSKAINSYFELIVNEIRLHGGDILKFAGDALFAEWSVSNGNDSGTVHEDSSYRRVSAIKLMECTRAAAFCGAAIVRKASGFKVYGSKGASSKTKKVSAGSNIRVRVATLDVHCGLGVGNLVGVHVGNLGVTDLDDQSEHSNLPKQGENRREFLFLGEPIDQVAKAESIASKGELVASSEAIAILSQCCDVPESILSSQIAAVIAIRSDCRISSKTPYHQIGEESEEVKSVRVQCKHLNDTALDHIRNELSLYVHPVVRGDELSKPLVVSQESHRAEAELRSVYVLFICPRISARITGKSAKDNELFTELSNIMMVTTRELGRYQGHLRQFIVDDKGVVLIGTFGLRGSTFPHMIGANALPATLAIQSSLKGELGVETSIGATFGKVYCGVVGGVRRHEFAVLGPSVNLAARLMASPQNRGILVDAKVQKQAHRSFVFQSRGEINAKGYAEPVATFEPCHAINKHTLDSIGIVGREGEIKVVIDEARDIVECSPLPTKVVFLCGETGVGKSLLTHHIADEVKKFCGLYHTHVALARSTSRTDEELVPFSAFRSIFLYAIREYCLFDGTISIHRRKASLDSLKQTIKRRDSLSSTTHDNANTSCIGDIPYLPKIRWVCEDLGFSPEYADIIGSRLLDIEDADVNTCTVNGEVPTLDSIVDFLAQAFIRFTLHAGMTFVTIDDVQWLDSLSWAVIQCLFERGEDLLLLCTVRENENMGRLRISDAKKWDEGDESESRFTQILLKPLELSHMKLVISRGFSYGGETFIDDNFAKEVYEKTGGIPVFVIELLENIKRTNMVEKKPSGMVGLRFSLQGEQVRHGTDNILDELFLQRFDALDVHVRKLLQVCAVLGMDFWLTDVNRVSQEFEDVQKLIDSAIAERILVDDDRQNSSDDEDGSNLSGSNLSDSRRHFSNDRSFHFSNSMWRDSVLKTMLTERKIELRRNIATAMEAEGISDSSDTRTLLKLFDHWKACNEFCKAAPLALTIGARLEEWESSQQSLDMYCDVLKMWRTDTKVNASLETLGAWYEPSLSSAALAYAVRLKTRIGKCLYDMGDHKSGALAYRDAYLIMTKLPVSKTADRTLLFPVISGLWLSIPWDEMVSKEGNFSLESELVRRFVDESQAHGDPVHICRALAMQASLYARMSDFRSAIDAQRELERIYSFRKHSEGICQNYGSDYAAVSYGSSVQWHELLGDTAKAMQQMDFVVRKLVPKFAPIAINDSMSILFPVLMVMKEKGLGRDAKQLLKKYVLDRFSSLGLSSSTYWYPLYKPTKILLEMVILDESNATEDATEDKALKEIEKWALQSGRTSSIAALERNGKVIRGDVCWRLARRKGDDDPAQLKLIEKGIELAKEAMKSMQRDGSYAFMMKHAYSVYKDLQQMKVEHQYLAREREHQLEQEAKEKTGLTRRLLRKSSLTKPRKKGN